MLTSEAKRRIDGARQVLVGVLPNPMQQVELITTALIYKFMDDMDEEARKLPNGKGSFFVGPLKEYSWHKLLDPKNTNQDKLNKYQEATKKISESEKIPELFRSIFRNTYLPFNDPRTLGLFLSEINQFDYDNSEELGNAYEYLLSIMGSQGDAGQFRTPRHIIDFIVKAIDPKKDDRILDPACGTAGFLISAYKHILEAHDGIDNKTGKPTDTETPLTSAERAKIHKNITGYDIDPNMVKTAKVNTYLHKFKDPNIRAYDTISKTDLWDEEFDIILANPPFMTPKGGIEPHSKFKSKANRTEVLFVDYILEHLSLKGRAGIIVPEGIIFQSANAYKALRKDLVEDGLYAVVSLPSGVFNPYSGVKTSILLFDKYITKKNKDILFIKINQDGYDLGAQRRETLDKNDLPLALEILKEWKEKQTIKEKQNIAFAVSKSEIAESGDYNLTGDRYREAVDYSNVEWEIFQLKELEESGDITLGRGQVISKKDIAKDPGIYPIYSSSAKGTGEFGKYAKYMFDEELITWSVDGGGRFFYRPKHKFSVTNVSGWIRINNKEKIDAKYLYRILTSAWEEKTFNYTAKAHPSVIREVYKIPLPPLEVQKQIVEELEGYQKVIDGAKQVVENWKPNIKIESDWEMVELGEVLTLEYGKSLPKRDRVYGEYPVMGSNGISGYHNKFLIKGPSIIVGRKGSAGEVVWVNKNSYPIDTTYFVKLKKSDDLKFIFFILQELELQKLRGGAGIPGLSRKDAYIQKIQLPPLEVQKQIVEEIEAEQKIVDQNKKLIEIFEEKIKRKISEIWGE